jgi:hypothetical protein
MKKNREKPKEVLRFLEKSAQERKYFKKLKRNKLRIED